MRTWVAAVFVASMAWLAYMGPTHYSVQAETPRKKVLAPVDEVYGFDELSPRHNMRKNIKKAFQSYYQYLAISLCFSRHNVTLPGFQHLFKKYSEMERENAEKLMGYMIKRGMTFDFQSVIANKEFINCYERDEKGVSAWSYVMKVIQHSLDDQKDRKNMFLKTHNAAVLNNFPHLKHFLEDEFLEQKVQMIKEIADYQTQLNRIHSNERPDLGLYMFDRSLLP